MKNEEILKVCKDVALYLDSSTDLHTSDLLYRTPAMAMREAADELDRKDKAIRDFRELIKYLEGKIE